MTGTACPDFAWHCDLIKRENLEEDLWRGKKASILSQKLLDCYIDLLISKSWSEGFCEGWYFLYQDSRAKGVSFYTQVTIL